MRLKVWINRRIRRWGSFTASEASPAPRSSAFSLGADEWSTDSWGFTDDNELQLKIFGAEQFSRTEICQQREARASF